MTEREALKLALEALKQTDAAMPFPVAKLAIMEAEKALAQPEQEPVAWLWELTGEITTDPDRADGMWLPLYTTQPQPKEPEQEPVALPCCGYSDASAIKWNPYNQVVQCHNCGQIYTTPPQRTWVGLDNNDLVWIYSNSDKVGQAISNTETKLKEKNT